MRTKLLTMGLGLLAGLAVQARETHVVESGETLWSISRNHGVSLETLRIANGLRDDLIVVGRRLVIPGGAAERSATHTVVRGENLFRIGRQHGVAVRALQDWNGLKRPEDLRAGTVLRLNGPKKAVGDAPVKKSRKVTKTPNDPVVDAGDEVLEPLVLTENMRFGELAAKHGMTVGQLNALNGWSFLKSDLLVAGTQVYVAP